MLKICICDNNRDDIEKYHNLITQIAEAQKLNISVFCFDSGDALLFNLLDNSFEADIIFLDILMPGMDGIKIAQKLRIEGCNAEIIFLTSSYDYIYDAFNVNAIQYLLKTAHFESRFEYTFLHAVSLARKKETMMFYCQFNGTKWVFPFAQISYFEIRYRVVILFSDGKEIAKFRYSMEQLDKRLSDHAFIRIHRSYLVNSTYILEFNSHNIVLKTGEVLPLGSTYVKRVKQAFEDYIASLNCFSLAEGYKEK